MAIILNNISKSFDGKSVLNDFSYQFESGRLYLVKGASGKGKTTLLNIIMGLQKADSGYVETGDRFSVLFQQYRLLEYYDVYTNLKIVNSSVDIREAVKQLLPEETLFQKVNELSGGMKQRLCIIRAMISESDTVIMDEPFNGLDEENIQKAISFIMDNLNGRTLIIATHQYEQLKDINMEIIEL